MNLGFTGRMEEYYLQAFAGKRTSAGNKTAAADGEVTFEDIVSARAAQRAAEQRQFKEEQKARKLRRAYYARINEESAIKRKLQEMERNRMYYQESVKALPLSSTYQKRVREAMACVSPGMITDAMADS